MKNKKMGGALKLVVLTGGLVAIILSGGEYLSRGTASAAGNNPKVGQPQVIFKLRSNTSQVEAEKLVKKYAEVKKVKSELTEVRKTFKKNKAAPQVDSVFSLEVEGGEDVVGLVNKLNQDPDVEYAQLNYVYEPDLIPSDPGYASQWSHPKTSMPQAWDRTTGNTAVTIALIGTGVNWNHADLAPNIWNNLNDPTGDVPDSCDRILNPSILPEDDDCNGYANDVRGWDFANSDNDPMDLDGHETSVAGVVAEVANNGAGGAGVCWNCKIMPLRVNYTTLDVANALYYAVANGAKVVNMSFGNYDITKYGPDTVVENAVNYGYVNGVLMVATAGNDSITTKRYPGALDNVIGVASTDSADIRSGFSNWGSWIDVAAPGTGIYSTTLAGGYGNVNGTSFSAPYVAGTAGLLLSLYPSITPAELRLRLEYTADKQMFDHSLGSGRLNANRATEAAAPNLFAIIKSPWQNDLLPTSGNVEIWGTALGDSYLVEYRQTGEVSWTTIGSGTQVVNGPLASLSVASLSGGYDIRLTATKGDSNDTHTVQVITTTDFQAGWPRALSQGQAYSPATIVDLDENGDKEILIGTSNGYLFALNHDGSNLAGWPRAVGQNYIFGAPAVGDVDGDGTKDVVVTTLGSFATGGKVMAWKKDGQTIPGWPKTLGQMRGSPVLVNLDEDAAYEIVVAETNGKVQAFNGDGSVVPGWPYTLPETNVQTSPAVGDVDGDGADEIVVSTWSYTVILEKNGALHASFAKSAKSHASPILVDVNADGKMDIVQLEASSIFSRNHLGVVIWTKWANNSFNYAQVSSADLDRNGTPEILVGSDTSPYYAYALSSSGSNLPGWPIATPASINSLTSADINGDGILEVIAGSSQGLVYAWTKAGSLLPGFPKATGSEIKDGVTIDDIDQDIDAELIVGAANGSVYVWDLPGTYSFSPTDWPMQRHNRLNTASYSLPVSIDTILPIVSIVNPANGAQVSGTVSVDASASDNVGVTLVEFSIDGTPYASDTSAPYTVSWNTSGLVANSSHTLIAKAHDAAGNLGNSAVVTVTIKDTTSPTVAITSPLNNALVSKNTNLTISASASDNIGITKVEFYALDTLKCTDTTAPYGCVYKTPNGKNVVVPIQAKAYDTAGNSATHSIRVTTK
ncbi:MAG: S8 family serine peptidase [Candidatus Uhrbacteria bacterium]|nr:S8 family serine peptidase [Candidatus Uhrbacteria bacterium]